MALALVDLDRAAAGPDRFADAARPGPGADVFVDELAPGGDDPGGVVAERLHVGKADPRRVGSQLALEQLDLLRSDRDQGRFSRLQGADDEGHRPCQKPLGAVVEHDFVTELRFAHTSVVPPLPGIASVGRRGGIADPVARAMAPPEPSRPARCGVARPRGG